MSGCVDRVYQESDIHYFRLSEMAEAGLEAARKYLSEDAPELAIQALESVPTVHFVNEHYMIKRSVILQCAYSCTGRPAAAEREAQFIAKLAFPQIAWELGDWWGDVSDILGKHEYHHRLQ